MVITSLIFSANGIYVEIYVKKHHDIITSPKKDFEF